MAEESETMQEGADDALRDLGQEVTEDVSYLNQEEEEEEAAEEEVAETGEVAIDTKAITEVQDKVFKELSLPADIVSEAQGAWHAFINSATSREAAGEAIYAALFDSAPSLQSLFKTPRAVMAMRFMAGLNSIVSAMHTPGPLKVIVETLGFQHLDLEVTVPRVVIFRDAILDLFALEMGSRLSSKAASGLASILNYVGGAYIYVRREYAGRLKIIASSWRIASNKAAELSETPPEDDEGEAAEGGANEAAAEAEEDVNEEAEEAATGEAAKQGNESGTRKNNSNNLHVPTDFNGMFMFNAAVMGFGDSQWMPIVLETFDEIVMNVANSYRLQEECDTLSLRLAKYKGGITLSEFKAVMLASLRSLVPKDWDAEHEVAWIWLWENVERMLQSQIGKPAVREKALERLIMSLTEDNLNYLRREVYQRFFALAPAGQDYFKQSTTRLYWIADKVVEMTMEMYIQPRKLVEDISALGLRHVGYAIPTELFAPFVSGAVEVIRAMNAPEEAEDAFRWCLSLIGRILVRTINEGSTLVMKAINTNNFKQLIKAVSVSPRGKRMAELLTIAVGTQSISPLYWAIESGSLESARAMLVDLLTIRADRDNYYYGCDALFKRHPDVVKVLSSDAAILLPTLLDGLIWRSRVTSNGQRRVNYFIKPLLVDASGEFAPNLEWLVQARDPKIIVHPSIILFSDMIWLRLASRLFLVGKLWFLFTLAVFLTGQSIIEHLHEDHLDWERYTIAACRVFIYGGSLGGLIFKHIKLFIDDIKHKSFVRWGRLVFPEYITNWQEATTFFLIIMLLGMFCQEPILHCLGQEDHGGPGAGTMTETCPDGINLKLSYSTFGMLAMILYWVLMIDFTIFSTRISSFVLVCGRVVSELFLFIGAGVFFILMFASSASTLTHKDKDFSGIPIGALSLMEVTLNMFGDEHFEMLNKEPILLTVVCFYIIATGIFLLNLLIGQFIGSYNAVFEDMAGFARLNRGKMIVTIMEHTTEHRWELFKSGCGFDDRLEFNEGDVGLAGGVQVLEPANLNPITVDMIKRFGGSTSPAVQWPEEEGDGTDDTDKFERLEKLIVRGFASGKRGGKSGAGSSGGKSGSASGSGSHQGPEIEGGEEEEEGSQPDEEGGSREGSDADAPSKATSGVL